jgi:hypothetical protein
MKENVKPILTAVLLTFAGVTLAVQIAKEFRTVEPMRLADGLYVICTHATQRCPACIAIERLTKETLDESFKEAVASGQIVFRMVNYEQAEVDAFANEFKVAAATVVLVNIKNGKTVLGKNLVNEAQWLHTDEPAYKKMLKEQINAMLQGKILETDEPHEIIFNENKLPYYLTEVELDKKLGVDEKVEVPKEYVWVVYFHRIPSCDTCLLMTQYTYETIEQRFGDEVKQKIIVFRYMNFEEEQNTDLVEKLGIKVPMLAVIKINDGKMEKAKLARKVWILAAEKDEFIDYVEKEIKLYTEELTRNEQ